jgi:hypothetical protein
VSLPLPRVRSVWLAARDLGELVRATVRRPGESRLTAARTAAVAASTQRALRENAFVRARRGRLVAAAALIALLALALLLAPAVADHVGLVPWEFPRWLAGLFDALANWWHHQSFGTQLAIGAAIAALVVLSGGTLGVALGVSGAVTWGLEKGNGIATFLRDPEQATDNYFATATPTQIALDTVGVVGTFLPMNFAGGLAARGVRDALPGVRTSRIALMSRARTASVFRRFRPASNRAASTSDRLATGELPVVGFRSDVSHIFRSARGHLSQDTPENRDLIRSAIDPVHLRQSITLPGGTTLQKYFKDLPDGTQVWVEVRNDQITNGGLNDVPR